jgi:hypothetical protein
MTASRESQGVVQAMVRIDVDRICRGKEPQPWSRLPIAQNTEIELAIREALDHLTCESLIRGKLVAVKPNDTWASASDKTGVTQPDTLRAVLHFVQRYEPRELIVTGGAGAAETDEVFRIAGLMDIANVSPLSANNGLCLWHETTVRPYYKHDDRSRRASYSASAL